MSRKKEVTNINIKNESYYSFHRERISKVTSFLSSIGEEKLVEIGGHPWYMTKDLLGKENIDLLATISAEEELRWPDNVEVGSQKVRLLYNGEKSVSFKKYTANVEREIFSIDEKPDIVLACEVIEHLIRSPHIMLLNMNRWLPVGGKIYVSTPNGAQFENPFRIKSKTSSYRSSVYSRHNHLFTMGGLKDIIKKCGFKIQKSGFLTVYERKGLSSLYKVLGKIPMNYFKQKFGQMMYVFAEKEKSINKAIGYPEVYNKDEGWCHVDKK